MERELVKIKTDNPAYNGYYTQFKDMMKPGDVIYGEIPDHPIISESIPIKTKPAEPKPKKGKVRK